MRFELEVVIKLPRLRVVELFLEPDNLGKWQPGFVSFDHIGGAAPRRVGARSRQVHRMGHRDVESIETITVSDHPDRFSATYEADGVWNLIENRFVDAGNDGTRWILTSELRCTGLFVRLVALLTPGLFRQQMLTFMERFKAFAEAAGP